ncbi:MAG: methyltransferase [Oscillospiraceae bacterium]|nr:methyltransferase [Oscillospiraceae bacterium]
MRFIEILDGGTVVRTSKEIRFTADPLLLAQFCRPREDDTCLDIGTGCGIIILWFCDRGLKGDSVAIDISPEAIELTKRGLEESGITSVDVALADARTFSGGPFSLIVCNPPYFRTGTGGVSGSDYRNISRSDSELTLRDMALCMARNLAPEGRACFCIPPARYDDAVQALDEAGLRVTRKSLVYNSSGSDEPRLILLEAGSGPAGSETEIIVEN